jgi:hypothetical protein
LQTTSGVLSQMIVWFIQDSVLSTFFRMAWSHPNYYFTSKIHVLKMSQFQNLAHLRLHATSHGQTLSHNVVLSTPSLSGISKFTMLVMIGTDSIGSYKFNYPMIINWNIVESGIKHHNPPYTYIHSTTYLTGSKPSLKNKLSKHKERNSKSIHNVWSL